MISWMQKHKKWLIITIWVSTIAFIGAGMVGWGSYNYGSSATSVARVGDIDIKKSDFIKEYSRLYNQYAQMFQGKFDNEKAKMFGLDKQALATLINRALILNLAKKYDITATDDEVVKTIASIPVFQNNGKFDKKTYKTFLEQQNLKPKEFEEDIKKDIIIKKLFKLLPALSTQLEEEAVSSIFTIGDKIKYKLISTKDIHIKPDEKKLKEFWEQNKNNYKTETKYEISYIIQPMLKKTFNEKEIKEFYNANKTKFRDKNGKILDLKSAKEQIIKAMNEKATKKEALKITIKLKHNEIKPNKHTTISESNNPFNDELLSKIKDAHLNKPVKPVKIGNKYIIAVLEKKTDPQIKSYEEAKADALRDYINSQKPKKLLDLANKTYKNFDGIVTDGFITINDKDKINLKGFKAQKFLSELFTQTNKNGFIQISQNEIVLYDILEQKLLTNEYNKSKQLATNIKSSIFNANLLKDLQNKIQIEIYYKGM